MEATVYIMTVAAFSRGLTWADHFWPGPQPGHDSTHIPRSGGKGTSRPVFEASGPHELCLGRIRRGPRTNSAVSHPGRVAIGTSWMVPPHGSIGGGLAKGCAELAGVRWFRTVQPRVGPDRW